MTSDGSINYRKFISELDYSLDQIKLREVYEKIYRKMDFSFVHNKKEYSTRVINVTFNYKVCDYNRINKNVYIKLGWHKSDIALNDNACIIDGELVAIRVGEKVNNPVPLEMLNKHFIFEDGVYKAALNKAVVSTSNLRTHLYENGFTAGGIHYVRWKRSCGSSRVGKCLFIDEKLYNRMHKWEMCGLKVKNNQEIDLAGLEAYISLPSSSIIDTLEINPENILVIDDYDSVFDDDVVSIEDKNNEVIAVEKKCTIKNSIWDGQGLLDYSCFGQYQDKGMLLLRNLFFKCCCFNTNIMQWFKDNNITDVSQLNGKTRATKLEDIKLITTPNSIKYLKFDSLDKWLDNVSPVFGIVKYDKPTHYFDGKMVRTHYQLLNTLQMSADDVKDFLSETLNFVKMLKTDPAVLRFYIKYTIEDDIEISSAHSKNDIIYKMLGVNDEFSKTKLYCDFRDDLIKSFMKNIRLGHILVNGNYSTLCGNPIEMLQSCIGKFNGESFLGLGNINSRRFNYDQDILASRSPHISMSNIWVAHNVASPAIDKYFNFTNEIVCVNSIGDNILNRLSGCDFDSDTVMLTDNKYLLKAEKKNHNKFKIAVSNVSGSKLKRLYNFSQQSELDIKTSNNLVGDIINLSQELNTRIWDKSWDKKHDNSKVINDIYLDVCKLNIMSNIEIDSAKREYNISNSKELQKLRTKYAIKDKSGKNIKPNFFAYKDKSKGYYNNKQKNYLRHMSTMDYLQYVINSFAYHELRSTGNKDSYLPFSKLIVNDGIDASARTQTQINRIVDIVRRCNTAIQDIYSTEGIDGETKYSLSSEERQNCIEYIGNIKFTPNTMVAILRAIETEKYKDIRRLIFNTLFGYPNTSFYTVIKESSTPISIIELDPDGDVDIYGIKYQKKYN